MRNCTLTHQAHSHSYIHTFLNEHPILSQFSHIFTQLGHSICILTHALIHPLSVLTQSSHNTHKKVEQPHAPPLMSQADNHLQWLLWLWFSLVNRHCGEPWCCRLTTNYYTVHSTVSTSRPVSLSLCLTAAAGS